MNLGGRLKYARERRNKMTQEQLAELASTERRPISQAAISALERRDSESTSDLFALARALRINPEWLQTGEPENDSGLETDAWRPAAALDDPHELALINDYRNASDAWKLTLRLMARTPPADQPILSRDMNILMTTIFGRAAPDSRLGDRWTRPDLDSQAPRKPSGGATS